MDPSEKLKLLPEESGVYLMKDASGKVIYAGKASSLKHRVRSYFQVSSNLDIKTRYLVQEIADFEYIVTRSEREALILEDTLIKKHQPRYNVRLRDDKRYPYLKLTNEKFPRLMIARQIAKDGARYFGPYTDSFAVRNAMKMVQQLFRIRTCNLNIQRKCRGRPCLDYYINLCDAPCVEWIDEKEYKKRVDEAALFLQGRHNQLLPELRRQMQEASEKLEFERAARLRDQAMALERLLSSQKVVETSLVDQDVIGFAKDEHACCVQVFFVRSGKLVGREHFLMEAAAEADPKEILTAFVKQYYTKAAFIPKEIILQNEIEEPEVIADWLSDLRGSKVRFTVPERGAKKQLVQLVIKNAELALREHQARRLAAFPKPDKHEAALQELQQVLSLETLPRRIEAFDISNIRGSEPVGSMVVFENGTSKKSDYRRFKIKYTEGPDDFAMMAEVVKRRLEHGLQEKADEKFPTFPDLILIDGGRGQLSAARKVMYELGLEKIPTIALAKEFEHIFVGGRSDPIVLPRNSPALHLLQRIRDEAHRFALSYHRILRQKRTVKSVLDDIPGLGPKRKKLLIQHFGSVKKLQEASLEELMQLSGLPKGLAKRVYQALHC